MAQMVNYTTYYLHQDALGSTRLVMPASIVSSFSSNYVPYGMDYAMVGEELFQYTGKLLDESTGLYYEGARYYDPTTGRFITEDSYNGTLTDPLSQNRYLYAEDNPMRYVDPTGHVIAILGGGGSDLLSPSQILDLLSSAASKAIQAIQQVIGSLASPFGFSSTSMATTTTVTTEVQCPEGDVHCLGINGYPSTPLPSLGQVNWNWNAALSLLVLVGGAMVTTGAILTGNAPAALGTADGDY
ncbi:MAG: RHS repeat-associated core domain-containing protein [Nitrososphaerota archaeon]|nr:RHS repeat-associated core domain-containing protein [Nitrososphaerota archaeon]